MLKSASDALILHSEETCNLNNNLKIIYQAAKILRKTSMTNEKWTFSGSITKKEITKATPEEFSFFIKWLITGKTMFDSTGVKNQGTIHQRQIFLLQLLMGWQNFNLYKSQKS